MGECEDEATCDGRVSKQSPIQRDGELRKADTKLPCMESCVLDRPTINRGWIRCHGLVYEMVMNGTIHCKDSSMATGLMSSFAAIGIWKACGQRYE